MIDYSNGKIYKIIDNTNGNIYIGSTCLTLEMRLANHLAKYNFNLRGRGNFTSSFDIIKNGDYKIELLELVRCENKEQLLDREKYYILNNECVNKTYKKKEFGTGKCIVNKIKVSPDRLICPNCNYKFTNKQNINRHIKNKICKK